ncbi:MAG: hypothetical protein LUH10_01735 [Tannerellaceae bacterium]|nr:hypothetical protein [Tannerellaceae bacterium]
MSTLEIWVVGFIVLLQVYITVNLSLKIAFFRKLLPSDPLKQIEMVYEENIPQISVSGNYSGCMERIKTNLNEYLLTNRNASINFTIMKDVVERETEVYEEEIANSVQTPLYLGLGATMIGVIFGLWSMDFTGDADAMGLQAVGSLIRNVGVAMFASLLGLLLTTFLSVWKFTPAKSDLLKGKNQFLNLLQTRLLPEINREDDSEISGLKKCLNEFSRNSSAVVAQMSHLVKESSGTVVVQQEMLKQMERLDIDKMMKYNVEVFLKIEKSKDYLVDLTDHLAALRDLTSHMKLFAERTSDIDEVVTAVRESLDESKALVDFLTKHTSVLEEMSETSEKKMAHVLEGFKDVVNDVVKEIKERSETINKEAATLDEFLKNVFQELYTRMSGVTEKYIVEYHKAINELTASVELKDLSAAVKQLKEQNEVHNIFSLKASRELEVQVECLNNILKEFPGRLQNTYEKSFQTLKNEIKRTCGPGKKTVPTHPVTPQSNIEKEEKNFEEEVRSRESLLGRIKNLFRRKKRMSIQKEVAGSTEISVKKTPEKEIQIAEIDVDEAQVQEINKTTDKSQNEG